MQISSQHGQHGATNLGQETTPTFGPQHSTGLALDQTVESVKKKIGDEKADESRFASLPVKRDDISAVMSQNLSGLRWRVITNVFV